MGYSSYQNSDDIVPNYVALVADKLTDIATLPTKIYAPGSTCLVIEDSSLWILSTEDKEWHKV